MWKRKYKGITKDSLFKKGDTHKSILHELYSQHPKVGKSLKLPSIYKRTWTGNNQQKEKMHIITVSAKLSSPETIPRKVHFNQNSSITSAKTISWILVPYPFLTHIEYTDSLPDYNRNSLWTNRCKIIRFVSEIQYLLQIWIFR